MIENINLKNSNGYLKATIDNQTIPLQLKEIEKDNVTIKNLSNTGIPLYTSIPIHIELITDNNNYIEKGSIKIKILSSDGKSTVLYEEDNYIYENKYKGEINEYLPLGKYIIDITYFGNKYFKEARLTYYLSIEKRPLMFRMDKNQYHGKPYEEVEVHLGIYDALNKIPIDNIRIDYIYNDTHYITKSDNEGNIDFQITIPNDCKGKKILIYIENNVYEYTSANIDIITDKLDTEITNTYSFEENNLILDGNVFAYNKDIMYNASYGNIELYIEDEKVDSSDVEDGIFKLKYDYNKLLAEYSSNETTIINNKSDINTKTELQIEIIDNIPGEVKFTVTVTDYNNIRIQAGMVYFQLNNDANYYITELDDNGQAICYFYIAEEGKYKIKYRYFGIFEYKDSEIKEEIIEVQ